MWNSRQEKGTRNELMAMLKDAIPRAKARVELQPGTDLRELGIDSLGLVMLVVRFCERYGFDPAALGDNVGAVRTVGNLLELAERMLDAPGAAGGAAGAVGTTGAAGGGGRT